MGKPVLLDLFAGAGGCGEGYARAGFSVVGVDLDPKPLRHNPHEHYVGDALAVLDTLIAGEAWQGYRLGDFAAIHASPPCQGYSVSKGMAKGHKPLLIEAVRQRLRVAGLPYIVENVTGAMRHLPSSVTLCGTQFGLKVYRHRLFESSVLLFTPCPCSHPHFLLPDFLCVYGNGARRRQVGNKGNKYQRATVGDASMAMGIDWMTQAELSQAIPPAYTEWLGRQLMRVVEGYGAA